MRVIPAVQGSFAIERNYDTPPERVFNAFSDAELKASWFAGPPGRWRLIRRSLDFHVGGREILHGKFHDGPTTLFDARIHEILPGERITYVYDMHLDDVHLSVSLATVELEPERLGTRLVYTEQVSFLDGRDGLASREATIAANLDRLVGVLGVLS